MIIVFCSDCCNFVFVFIIKIILKEKNFFMFFINWGYKNRIKCKKYYLYGNSKIYDYSMYNYRRKL